jgi:L-threonylcarbamoyladenylate synthase
MPKVSQAQIINQVQQGRVISFPTDTVAALAALPIYSNLIFAAKKRPPDKLLMGARTKDLWPYVSGTAEEREIWQKITKQHWPGQLTLVLPASEKVPPVMNPLDPHTIGLRVPNHALARTLLAQTGPLATTSANLSGQDPLVTPTDILEAFPDVFVLDRPDAIYLGSGLPSTVVKWTGEDWQILRQGHIKIT